MTAELIGAGVTAPTRPERPGLAAVRAAVVDHIAFERGEMVMDEELVVGAEFASPDAEEATALVVVLALDVAALDVGTLVDGGPVDQALRDKIEGFLELGRGLADLSAAQYRLASACWVCGCSEDRSCADGCGWATANLCTACVTVAADTVGACR